MAKPTLTFEEFKQSVTKMSGEMTTEQIQRSNDLLKKIEESLNKENKLSAIQDKTLTDIKNSLSQGGNVEKSLEKIQKSQEQSTKVLNESLSKIGRNYNPLSNIKDETPLSIKEILKQSVAGIKKSAFGFGEKTYKVGSNILEAIGTPQSVIGKAAKSLKASAGGTIESAKDILSTPMDYTIEGGRFAEAYSKQAQEKRELQGGSLLSKNLENQLDQRVGLTSYNRLKQKENELEDVNQAIKKQTDYGFSPLRKDVSKIEEIKKEIERVDVRNAPVQNKVQAEQQKKEDFAIAETRALRQENPEADNVRSAQEIVADNSKEDLQLTKELLDTTKESVTILKDIRQSLADQIQPLRTKEQPIAPQETTSDSGSSLLGSAADVLSNLPGRGKSTPKPTGKPSLGGRIMGGIKSAGPGLLKGGAAALGGMALGYGAEKLVESGHEKVGGAVDVGAEALSGAGMGAMIGSIVPGIGTGIGAAIGGVAGGAYGLYKNFGNIFGGDKKGDAKFKFEEEADKIAQEELKKGADPLNLANIISDKLQDKYPNEDLEWIQNAAERAADKANNQKVNKLNSSDNLAANNRTIEGKVERAESPSTGASGFPLSQPNKLDEIKTYKKGDPLPLAPNRKELERMNQELQKNKDSGVQEGIERAQKNILGGKISSTTLAGISPAAVESPDIQLDRDIKENRARARSAPNVEPIRRAPSELSDLSLQYNDEMREAAQSKPTPAPIIMNNSSNNSTTKILPMKADPRPSSRGSALDRHIDRVSTY